VSQWLPPLSPLPLLLLLLLQLLLPRSAKL
jgi:hypothetical protein